MSIAACLLGLLQRPLPSAGGLEVRCQDRFSCTGVGLCLAAGSVPAEHRETAWTTITTATATPTTTNGDGIFLCACRLLCKISTSKLSPSSSEKQQRVAQQKEQLAGRETPHTPFIYFTCSLPRKCMLRLFVMPQKALMPVR